MRGNAPRPDRSSTARAARVAGRIRGSRRLAPLLAASFAVLLLLAACGEQQIYSTIAPRTEKADDIQGLYTLIFWAALVVFVGVQGAIVYTILRFRRRNDELPEQIHGSKRLEIAWTILPAIVLLAVFIPTAQVIFKQAAAEESADFVIDIVGKQWWWEISYPGIPANDNDPNAGPLVTANEVMLPEGANVVFNLLSNNVIHSFWVPQLSGKTDVIPGHQNKLQFVASNVGEYFGECAEFCGASHAWMRFKVLVVPQAEFDAWVQAWRSPPPVPDANPETTDVVDAPASFATCLACHNITGTNANLAQIGLGSDPKGLNAGPNLTLLACRDTIAAGLLENNRANLERWLKNTDDVKEGVYMPNYYEDGVINDEQVAEIAAYLESLQPEGGCPEDPPIGGGQPTAADNDAP